ncbi:VCBS precursor [Algibacter lectus]|uniref:VCBS n=1 Tax=Algibacter lectus TaxID=221126 RepID=A0A090X063_9FLAO|nr:hypothetical protein [Algibacter lectus]GAL82616.1 VCBS precursor [Algibacter lectus]
MKVNYLPRLTSPNKALTFIALLLLVSVSSFAQIGVQSTSIRENVTFQWSDEQDIDNNGDISDVENNRPATIASITVNGAVYNTFAVPSGYQLTRLGPGGHAINEIFGNGISVIKSSATATDDINDITLWDSAALETFESKT